MRLMVFAVCFIVFMFVTGCDEQKKTVQEYPGIYFPENQVRIDDDLWYICFGTSSDAEHKDMLNFVLFEHGSVSQKDIPGVRRVVSRQLSHKEGEKSVFSKQEGWLIDSYGGNKMIQLPTGTILYEIVDGKIVTNDAVVTLDQLKSFLDSEPKQYTIDVLLEYIKQ